MEFILSFVEGLSMTQRLFGIVPHSLLPSEIHIPPEPETLKSLLRGKLVHELIHAAYAGAQAIDGNSLIDTMDQPTLRS